MNNCSLHDATGEWLRRLLLCTVLVLLVAGCWKEVPYTDPDSSASESPSPFNSSSPEKLEKVFREEGEEREEDVDNAFADALETALVDPPDPPFPDALENDDAEQDNHGGEESNEAPHEEVVDALFGDLDSQLTPPEISNAGRDDQEELPLPEISLREARELVPGELDPSESNSRRKAWLLGSKLSLAILARDQGAPLAQSQQWFKEAQVLAGILCTVLPEMPSGADSPGGRAVSSGAMAHLLPLGRKVGQHLATEFGSDHAALFEVAFKSNMLLALYRPGSKAVNAIESALAAACSRANLPSELWQPLQTELAKQPNSDEVKQAVFQFHEKIELYLSMEEVAAR